MTANLMAKMLSKREDGFTLVELVVAMFVIGIVLVSLIGVQLSAMVTITNATKRQMATQYANEAMETLRAMPWDVLNKGNVPGFHTAGGNVDPYYSGTNTAGTVTVDGETYTVRFATSNAQNLAAPRPPLFSSNGANVLVREDPERQGHEYTIRAYVVNSLGGTAASVGILVIVSWDDARTGERLELALRSSAYPGSQGCGQTSVQPFLSACEDTYGFSATAGYVTTTVVATEIDSTTVAPLLPGSSLQEFTVRSAYVLASAESVQVTSVENKVRRGGVNGRSMPPSATTVSDGFGEQGTEASNDFTSSSGIPADDLLTITSGSSSSESYDSGDWEIAARSDDGRTGTARSSTTNACNGTALIAGEPCSYINLSGSARVTMELAYDGASFFPLRRYGNASSSAGGGRFVTTKPGSDYGCQTLTSSGCTSGLAEYQESDIRIGAFTTGTWAESPSYLVQIADYSDEVLTQRGHAQPSAGVVSDRTATVRYWDGTTLRTVAVDENSSGVLANTGTVTWSPSAGVTITASASISATPVSSQLLGEDPIVACATDVCGISATTGSISVTVQYRIVTPSGSWDMYQNTSITGSASSSSYSRQE